MAIAKLSLIHIVGDMKNLDKAILQCLDQGNFHPEKSIDYSGGVRGFTALEEENPYAELLSRITDVGMQTGLHQKPPAQKNELHPADVQNVSYQYFQDFYELFKQEFTHLQRQRNYLNGEIEQDRSVLRLLQHINSLDVDLDRLFSCTYIKIRIGRLPTDSYQKLSFYQDKLFTFIPFDMGKSYCWGIYLTLDDYASEIDDLFSSLYFERLRVPSFVHGKPEEALEKLRENLAQNEQKLVAVQQELAALAKSRQEEYWQAYQTLSFLSDSFAMRSYVSTLRRDYLHLFHITGFIDEKSAPGFAKELRKIDSVTVEILPAGQDKRIKEPTKLKNGWFAKPFEMFVEMYGLPSYNDVDPTPYVAFTYCLLFGIMFGDLGQGLLLILAGALLWKWKRMNIGRVINRVGIFSSIFGTLYGSVFGFEHLLDPLYQSVFGLAEKPVEVMAPSMTNVILAGAVGLGVALILVSIGFNIFIQLRKRDFPRALLSQNGIAGLVFYTAVLVGAVLTLLAGKHIFTPPYVLLFIVLPLLIMLFKEPLGALLRGEGPKKAKPADGMGAYLLEGVFELFEVVLSFFSNTMSFLRVGGFVLSHAGMMAVVFTLSEMTGGAASPIVIVIGNLFVIGMEGLIVGIQVLRLEFYEMFSRYFDGDGKPFVPFGLESTK